jgi:hypothetical protein
MLNRDRLYSSIANQKRGPRKSDGPGLTRKVGGWVFGKWGASPAPTSPTATRAPSILSQETQSTQDTQSSEDTATTKDAADGSKKKDKLKLRPSGVNQNGPIWGLFDDVPDAPAKVVVQDYDADALGEALAEAS